MNRVRSLWLVLIAMLLVAPFALAANDPGHDSLYVLRIGDTNVTGSINLTGNVTASFVRFTSKAFGDYLDIIANGTVLNAPSTPRIMGATNSLYIDSTGNLYLNTKGGTTGIVQIGDTATNAVTLNVSGVIRQQNVLVCLANGTNCISGTNGGNVTTVTAGDGLADSGTATDPVLDVNVGDGISIAGDTLIINNASVCRSDGTGCPAAAVAPGSGWQNTSTLVHLSRNTTNVSVGNTTENRPILFVDSTNGRIGVSTSTPTQPLDVYGNALFRHGNVTMTALGSDSDSEVLLIEKSDGTDVFRVRDSGYVFGGKYIEISDGTNYADTSVLITGNSNTRTWLLNLYDTGSHRLSLSRSGQLRVGPDIGSPNAMTTIESTVFGTVGLIVQGATSQTADLQQWMDASNAALARVDAYGVFNLSQGVIVQGQNVCLEDGTNCPAAGGNVSSSTTSTDNAVARWDSTTGTTIQNSAVIIDDTGNIFFASNFGFTSVTASAVRFTDNTGGNAGIQFDRAGGATEGITTTTAGKYGWGVDLNGPDTTLRRVGAGHVGVYDSGSNYGNLTVARIGIGTTALPATLNVNGSANITGTIYQNSVAVCLSDGTNCPAASAAGNITGAGTTNSIPYWTNSTNLGNSILSQSGGTIIVNGNISTPTSFFIGNNANIGGTNSLSIGTNAYSYSGIAIGYNANAAGNQDLTVGINARSIGGNSIAIGLDAYNSPPSGVAIGHGANNTGLVALGPNTKTGTNDIAIGNAATATGGYGISVGLLSNSSGQYAISMGYLAKASAESFTAGWNANSTGTGAISIGTDAAAGHHGIAIGYQPVAQGTDSISIGTGAISNGTASNSVAIGYQANVTATQAAAIGFQANANGIESVAIGKLAKTSHRYSIALGMQAETTAQDQLMIGNFSRPLNTIIHGTLNATGTIYQNTVAVCLSDGTNCPSSSGASGWTNSSGSGNVSLTNNNANVSINALFIDNTNGRVSIGSTQPAVLFQINRTGTGALQRWTAGTVRGEAWINNDADFNIGTQSNHDLGFYTNDATRLWITDTGFVGIGTLGPVERLAVNSSDATYISTDAVTEGGFIIKKSGTVKWYIYEPSGSNDLRLQDSSADRVTFENGGYVGIGTTNPTQQVHINGTSARLLLDAAATNQDSSVIFAQQGADKAYVEYIGTTFGGERQNTFELYTIAGVDQTFMTGAAERLRIDSTTGYVGIGTTDPTVKLHVNGSIIAIGNLTASGLGNARISLDDNSGGGASFLQQETGPSTGFYVSGGTYVFAMSPRQNGLLTHPNVVLGSNTWLGWNPGTTFSESTDVAINRTSAGNLRINNGSAGLGNLTLGTLHATQALVNGFDVCLSDGTNCPAAGGNVSSSTISTDNAVVRWDGAGGNTTQNSAVIIDDTGNIYFASNFGFTSVTASAVRFTDNTGGNAGIQFDRAGGATEGITTTTSGKYGWGVDLNGADTTLRRVGAGHVGVYDSGSNYGNLTLARIGVGTTALPAALNVNGSANITGTIYQNSIAVCLSDGTNCPTGGSPSGWTNTTTQVYLANNATNVSIGNPNTAPTLFIDNANGRVGINTSTPEGFFTIKSGATTIFNITNAGFVQLGGYTNDGPGYTLTIGSTDGSYSSTFTTASASTAALQIRSNYGTLAENHYIIGSGRIGWGAAGFGSPPDTSIDTGLNRSSAGTLRITNGTTGLGNLTLGTLNATRVLGTGYYNPTSITGMTFSGDSIDFVQNTVSYAYLQHGVGLRVSNGYYIGFASDTSAVSSAADTAITRASAGVVKVTDGSTGTGNLIAGNVTTQQMNITGQVNVTAGNVSVQQGNGICFNAACTSRIYYNGSATIIEG